MNAFDEWLQEAGFDFNNALEENEIQEVTCDDLHPIIDQVTEEKNAEIFESQFDQQYSMCIGGSVLYLMEDMDIDVDEEANRITFDFNDFQLLMTAAAAKSHVLYNEVKDRYYGDKK